MTTSQPAPNIAHALSGRQFGVIRLAFQRSIRLPAAISEPHCYRDMKLHSLLFGWRNPDQALRVAAGILGERASGGRTQAFRVRYQGCEAFPTMHRTWKPQSGVELELGDMVKTK